MTSTGIPNIRFRPNAAQEISLWVENGKLELPKLPVEAQPQAENLSNDDRRLLHHCCAVYSEMAEADVDKLTIWTSQLPIFLTISKEYDFVQHAILALAATHLSWITKSTKADPLIFHHRGLAYKGLQSALENFSQENSDGVLAASVVMSWQVEAPREWATMIDGVSKTFHAMQPWKANSKFQFYLDEDLHTPAVSRDTRTSYFESPHPDEPRLLIGRIRTSLEAAQPCLIGYDEQSNMVQQLLVFTENLTIAPPGATKEDQLNKLSFVRPWLSWFPESALNLQLRNPPVLLAFALLYMVTLAVSPLFEAIGPGYFTSLRAHAILNLNDALLDRVQDSPGGSWKKDDVLRLMKQPVDVALGFSVRVRYG